MSASPSRRSRSRGGRRAKRKGGSGRLRTVDETSAGGLVVDHAREQAVVIGRLDRKGRLLWSLPKGHIEEGESREQTAIREIEEETGVTARVLGPLGSIDYWFIADGRRIHKTVHHFLLEWCSGELSDEDVEVTEVAWVPIVELLGRLAYPDERHLVRQAAEELGVDIERLDSE
ncbi:NUDIX hydrolase [Sciscionella marina]|uniref:NUDIX hydrolase n=1 Tax=Sciscionella marina TaxID=508770 RepID=UPI000590A1E6|nr:NUDIX hydrolase [Sciscionella marina]